MKVEYSLGEEKYDLTKESYILIIYKLILINFVGLKWVVWGMVGARKCVAIAQIFSKNWGSTPSQDTLFYFCYCIQGYTLANNKKSKIQHA
jgi:hypothetical protein